MNQRKISSKKAIPPMKVRKRTYLLLLLIAGVCVWGVFFRMRWDMTEDRRFSLSQATKDILRTLPDKVAVHILLAGALPAEFQKLSGAVDDMLNEMNYYAGGKLHFYKKSPFDAAYSDSTRRLFLDSIYRLGLRGTNVEKQLSGAQGRSKQMIIAGAILSYKNRVVGVSFLSEHLINSVQSLTKAEALLEYKLMYAIDHLVNPTPPLIAYATGHGEPLGINTYDMFSILARAYRVDTINIKQSPFLPQTIKTLLIVKPQRAFSEMDKIKIDQFIMRGGRVLFALDNTRAALDFLRDRGAFTAQIMGLNLEDMLFQYGVRLGYNMVMDAASDRLPVQVGWMGDKPQFNLIPFPYFPLLKGAAHPISKNMDLIRAQFASSLDMIHQDSIEAVPLLFSSRLTRKQGVPSLVSWERLAQIPLQSEHFFNQASTPVAALLYGRFSSFTQGRLTASIKAQFPDTFPLYEKAHTPSKLIVIADGDLVLNEYAPSRGPFEMGVNPYTQYKFANSVFFENAVAYLSSDNALIEARNKEATLRILNKKRIEQEASFWVVLNMGLPILCVVFAFILYQVLRYHTYKYK